MRAKIGDVVIDRTYNKKGNLAIVVGEGISQPILIDHNGGIARDKLRDYFAVWDGLEVIGHIDFERIWEEAVRKADRKTEPQRNGYDKGLQLFADILFDKEKREQFLKECKSVGIDPQEREGE